MRPIPPMTAEALKNRAFVDYYKPTYQVTITDQNGLATAITDVMSVQITRDIGQMAASFSLTLANPIMHDANNIDDPYGGKWTPEWSMFPRVVWPNNRIAINLGYGSELSPVFQGYIDDVSIDNSGNQPTISVKGRDVLKLVLDQQVYNPAATVANRFTRTYKALDATEIVRQLLLDAGFLDTELMLDTTGIIVDKIIYSNCTYADAIDQLAQKCGYRLYADEYGYVHWTALSYTKGTPVYEYRQGIDLKSINYTYTDNEVYAKIIAYNSKRKIKYELDSNLYSASVPAKKVLLIESTVVNTVAQLQALAQAEALKQRIANRNISVSVVANPYLEVGDEVSVYESATTISTAYRISAYSMSMTATDFSMTLQLYLT